MSWQSSRAGRRLVLRGIAYPRVNAGKGKTKKITSDLTDPMSYYHDGALQLNEQDLIDIKGTVDAPICYNHDVRDVVGSVASSRLQEDSNALEIVASLPMDEKGRVLNSKGVDVRQEIEEGKLRGFSVRYLTRFDKNRNVTMKTFQEISLVPEPFFDGCDLTLAIVAGQQNQGNNGKRVYN